MKDDIGAYEAAIPATAARQAPWYVVPADWNWVARVVGAVDNALAKLDLRFPEVGPEKKKELAAAPSRSCCGKARRNAPEQAARASTRTTCSVALEP